MDVTEKQGALAAGQGYWEMGDPADREMTLKVRYPLEQTCDAIAEQAALFKPQAMAIADKIHKPAVTATKKRP